MKNKVIKILVILTILLIVIDQASKLTAKNLLGENLIGSEDFGLGIVFNTGMALGFYDGNAKNIVLTSFILIIVCNFIRNQIERIDAKTAVALSLVLAGGFSNLIDRIFRKGVLDFIKSFGVTVNLADIFVVVGWILLVKFLIDYQKTDNPKVDEQKEK